MLYDVKNDDKYFNTCTRSPYFVEQNSAADIWYNSELTLCNQILYVGYCAVIYFTWVFNENTHPLPISNNLPLAREIDENSSTFAELLHANSRTPSTFTETQIIRADITFLRTLALKYFLL